MIISCLALSLSRLCHLFRLNSGNDRWMCARWRHRCQRTSKKQKVGNTWAALCQIRTSSFVRVSPFPTCSSCPVWALHSPCRTRCFLLEEDYLCLGCVLGKRALLLLFRPCPGSWDNFIWQRRFMRFLGPNFRHVTLCYLAPSSIETFETHTFRSSWNLKASPNITRELFNLIIKSCIPREHGVRIQRKNRKIMSGLKTTY